MPLPESPPSPGLVLDTNVVLDWLLFRDARIAAIAEAIRAGRVQWWATAALREECSEVLARGLGAAYPPDLAAIRNAWDQHAWMHPSPPPRPLSASCRCTDADDQKFIDFALHSGARWLLSHDKAVLRLAAQARRLGLLILPPHRWQLELATLP